MHDASEGVALHSNLRTDLGTHFGELAAEDGGGVDLLLVLARKLLPGGWVGGVGLIEREGRGCGWMRPNTRTSSDSLKVAISVVTCCRLASWISFPSALNASLSCVDGGFYYIHWRVSQQTHDACPRKRWCDARQRYRRIGYSSSSKRVKQQAAPFFSPAAWP